MNQEELNDYVNKLMQMSVEDIKTLNKIMSEDSSKSKVNTTQSLQEELEKCLKQPGFQETAMPKQLMNNVFREQGCDLKKLEEY